MSHIDAIRKALAASNRPLAEIARDTGIHWTQLSRFKSGARGIGPEALERLALALGGKLEFIPSKKTKKIIS